VLISHDEEDGRLDLLQHGTILTTTTNLSRTTQVSQYQKNVHTLFSLGL